jgi:uncharacterized Zn finger protein
MNRWDRPGWYQSAPKRPPPKRGIKVKKSGTTWWGQRWVEALERLSAGYSSRLARGRSYARAGRTHDLVVQEGTVTAKVTGSRATPYKVTISLTKLSDAVWAKAIAAMARKAQFSADLLAGRMPEEIDAAFKEADASVFPTEQADLSTHCSCPDWANPCKHVAATHTVLGEALDRDPFLLFELRGRAKTRVLEALRASRTGGDAPRLGHHGEGEADAADDVPKVLLDAEASDYDAPREPLPALQLSFEAPSSSGTVLCQLGTPSGWNAECSPAEVLGPMIRAAGERARELALAQPATEANPDPDPAPVSKARRSPTGKTKTGRKSRSPSQGSRSAKKSAAGAPGAKKTPAKPAKRRASKTKRR